MSGSGGLARIYVADNDNVDVSFFLSHFVRGEIILDEMLL